MTLPLRACALPSSSRAPTHACCGRNSLRSCLLVHPVTLLYGPPLTVSRLRLTAAARRKNSSPENLTHLNYNLLGKNSSRYFASGAIRESVSESIRAGRFSPDSAPGGIDAP